MLVQVTSGDLILEKFAGDIGDGRMRHSEVDVDSDSRDTMRRSGAERSYRDGTGEAEIGS